MYRLGQHFMILRADVSGSHNICADTQSVEQRCQKCGNTFSDIVRSGKVGCSECYETFYDKLLPSIQRIHGRIKHNGKQVPVAETTVVPAPQEEDNLLENLKKELAAAIEKQDFEQAVVIRDKIKELESK